MADATLISFGAQSTVSRWFDQYWSENDRRAFPWLCVVILGVLLAFGPPFLLWLVGLLPADDLGNSGASIMAHQIVIAIASLLGLMATGAFLRILAKPAYIELDDTGVAMVWNVLFLKFRDRRLAWSDITSIHIFQPLDKTDFRLVHLNFSTLRDVAALSLPLDQIEGDERRLQLADAISKHAVHAVENRVFSELAPHKDLSFTSLWLEALTAAPERDSLVPLTAGTILDGRYCIKERLGSGGQGTVYLADDCRESTQVVLKESMLPVYADIVSRKQALEAFHKEAFALESVKHDNVVRYLGSFVADHRAYLVLQLVPGRTLAALVKETGPLPPKRAATLALQMCDILSHLHGLTPILVHRDFTPDNLIVGADDKLTLIDFAVSVASWSVDDAETEVAGKAAYMAPEQFRGRPCPQSDVYSLGATLHYILTGNTPEPLDESHPVLTNESVGKDLSDVVAAATRLDPSLRLTSASAVKEALLAVV